MSRLDFLTIAIVTVCIVALGYLVYKTIGLMGSDTPKEQTEAVTNDPGKEEVATFDDEGELISDEETESGESNDYDLDDEQLNEENTLNEDNFENPEDGAELTAEEPEEEVVPTPAEFTGTSTGAYLVLAGSYRVKSNAENQVRKLKRLGYDDAEVTIFNRGAYATVLVDRFESQTEARELANELKDKHSIEAIVQKKKGEQ